MPPTTDQAPNVVPPYVAVVCPLCLATAPTGYYASGSWRCFTCYASWDTFRLGTVEAYRLYCAARVADSDRPRQQHDAA